MAVTFEVIHKDIMGRTGKLRVGDKTVKTPLLLPVINPHIQLITPQEMQELGVEALITNAYIFSKSKKFREDALERGLHDVLGFDGVIMTDSGAFQQSIYGDVTFTNSETVQFQSDIGSEIIVPMDIATHPDVEEERATEELQVTMERIEEAMAIIPDGHLAAPVQGASYLDLREEAGKAVSELGARFTPIGAVVPLMESYRYRELVEVVLAAKRGLSPSTCVHLFGAGHPAMLALATAMGCDVFDSAAYALYAREGRYMTTKGTLHLKDLQELPCCCSVCRTHTAQELKNHPDREKLLAMHNLQVTLGEIATIRQAIVDGTLWELVDERCRSHPKLLAGYRALLEHTEELESSDRVTKRRFFYRGTESCRRTEVLRYHRLTERFETGKRTLISMTGEAPEENDFDTVFFFEPPFGPYPPEMNEVFPVGMCEIPEWDEAMVTAGCLGIRHMIETHPESSFTVYCPEEWQPVTERELARLEVTYAKL